MVAAKSEGLPQKQARAIELGRRGSCLLKFEVLDRAADSAQLRERPLGDDLGNEVGFATRPELQSEEYREGAREASFEVRHERVDAAVRIRVRSREPQLPARNVGELPVGVPALVVEVVQAML